MSEDSEECETQSWAERISVAGRWTLVAGATVLPLLRGSWRGALRGAGSAGLAIASAKAIKSAVDRWRPDGSNENSFPSGHTADSAAAAASLTHTVGGPLGLAARALAAVTGAARWRCRKHHIGDVVAGALIGLASERLVRRIVPSR